MQKRCIFGVKTDNKFIYIGKSDKCVDGKMCKSQVLRQYSHPVIRQQMINGDTDVVILHHDVNEDWYDEKLKTVVQKHKENQPLLNAQWMLDGKRGRFEGTLGWWYGKKRDEHTLSRLSESKYKRILQYDRFGNLIRIWDSGKQVGTEVFKDYQVINGGGDSKIYEIIKRRKIINRLFMNSYWFGFDEILEKFNYIPDMLDIISMIKEEKIEKSLVRKPNKSKVYSVNEYDENNKWIRKYRDSWEAGLALNLHYSSITKICRGIKKLKNNHHLVYGEKIEK
jgi:hypothetical protein